MTKWNLEKLPKSIPVDENFPDLSNDPVIVLRAKQAEELIAKYGLPESFEKKTKAKNRKKPISSKTRRKKS